MRRTIKYRSKRIDNGEWVQGYLVPLKYRNKEQWWIMDHIRTGAVYGNQIDPDTIGQFTGLLDRDGKEIFEGDIIEMHTKEWGDEKFVIDYENSHLGAFSLCMYDELNDTLRFAGVFGKYGYEPFYCNVIGNIYDNPELLKGGNNDTN